MEEKQDSLSYDPCYSLRNDILRETLKPGQKLIEQDLSARFGISRTPVRDCLRKLAAENLLELVPNRGAYVIGFSKGDAADMFELRRNAEAQAIRWAVERFYEEELEILEETYEILRFYSEKEDLRKLRELGRKFHDIIYNACHNRELISQLETFRLYLSNSTHVKRLRREYVIPIQQEHSAIFEAFINRSADAAAKAMCIHIDNAAARAMR